MDYARMTRFEFIEEYVESITLVRATSTRLSHWVVDVGAMANPFKAHDLGDALREAAEALEIKLKD